MIWPVHMHQLVCNHMVLSILLAIALTRIKPPHVSFWIQGLCTCVQWLRSDWAKQLLRKLQMLQGLLLPTLELCRS